MDQFEFIYFYSNINTDTYLVTEQRNEIAKILLKHARPFLICYILLNEKDCIGMQINVLKFKTLYYR